MNFRSLILICAVGMAFGQPCTISGPFKLQGSVKTNCVPAKGTSLHWSGTDTTKAFEPLDVPAIQLSVKDEPNGPMCNRSWGCGKPTQWCIPSTGPDGQNWEVCSIKPTYHTENTCAQKSRILEHDENDPPKYWCRKVQN